MRHPILIGLLSILIGLVTLSSVHAQIQDPPEGQPLVLFVQGNHPAQEIIPLSGEPSDAVALTDLGLISVSGPGSSSHQAPLAAAVVFAGSVYDVRAEGVYRFIRMPTLDGTPGRVQNLISVQNLDTMDSLVALFAGIAQLHVQGVRHESDSDLVRTMQSTGWTSLRCGQIADLGIRLLTTLGFESRMVSAITQEPLNGYDNFHAMLEVFLDDSQTWMVVDLDLGTIFRDQGTGTYLSAMGLQQAVLTNQSPQVIRLAPLAIDYDFIDGFDYTPWAKWRFSTDDALWSWYRRVWQQLN
jgi:hypothetical protein